MRKKVSFLQSHVAGLQMKLDLVPDFDYASAWFDPGKISPVDRFVLSAIECSLPETHLSMQVLLKGDYWAIKIKDTRQQAIFEMLQMVLVAASYSATSAWQVVWHGRCVF